MKRITIAILLLTSILKTNAQNIRVYEHISLGLATTNKVTVPSFSYTQTLRFGKQRSYSLGTGIRFNYFNFKNRDFNGVEAKINNVSISPTPKLSGVSINTPIIAEFNTKKILLGINIDIIGFTFGKIRANPLLTNYNGMLDSLNASPKNISLLLLGKNNRGTLNSEIYLGYKVFEELTIRGGVSSISSSITGRYTPKSGKETTLGRFQTSQILPFFSLVFNIER